MGLRTIPCWGGDLGFGVEERVILTWRPGIGVEDWDGSLGMGLRTMLYRGCHVSEGTRVEAFSWGIRQRSMICCFLCTSLVSFTGLACLPSTLLRWQVLAAVAIPI